MDSKINNHEWDLLADQFTNHLRVERGLADNTIEAYSRDLKRFLQFLGKTKLSPFDIAQENIMDYIDTLQGNLSIRSIARNLSALKMFFRFLVSDGKIRAIRQDAWVFQNCPRGFRKS